MILTAPRAPDSTVVDWLRTNVHRASGEDLQTRHMYLERINRLVQGVHRRPASAAATAVSSTTPALAAAPVAAETADDGASSLYEAPESLYDPPGSDLSAGYVSPAWSEDDDDLESLVSSPSAGCTSAPTPSSDSTVCHTVRNLRAAARKTLQG